MFFRPSRFLAFACLSAAALAQSKPMQFTDITVDQGTGSVTVTTPGGAATSSTTFTVEPSATTATLVQHAVSHGPGTARPTVTWTQTTTTGESEHSGP